MLKKIDAQWQAKILRVEMNESDKVRKWSARDFGPLAMLELSVAGVVVPLFVLCSH